MIKIVKPGKFLAIVFPKCPKCEAELEYGKEDIKVFNLGEVPDHYIICPCCGEHIHLDRRTK